MSPRDLGALSPLLLSLRAQVLTLVGDAFPRRVGLSLLAQIDFAAGSARDAPRPGASGHSQPVDVRSLLLTNTAREFEDVAVRLATARGGAALSALRRRLIEAIPTAPLFNTMQFTNDMERAYTAMWDAHLAGKHEARAADRAVRHLVIGGESPAAAGLA